MRIAREQLAVRPENFLCYLLQALVELAPKDFLDGALGTRHTRGSDAAEGAHLVEAHDFNFRAALREFLADNGVLGSGPGVALYGPRKFDKARDETLEDEMQAGPVRTTLVHQRAHCHIPAVVYLAKDIFDRDAHIAKEQLAEFGLAGHLPERANFNAG